VIIFYIKYQNISGFQAFLLLFETKLLKSCIF